MEFLSAVPGLLDNLLGWQNNVDLAVELVDESLLRDPHCLFELGVLGVLGALRGVPGRVVDAYS